VSTTDAYGQGIGLWSLTDAPDIPAAIALFAKGALPRLRLTFASATVRGATLTGNAAPVPGMMTWLTDVGRLDIYDGSGWSTVATGTRAWTTVSLASGFSHNGNNNGSLRYRVVNMFGEDALMLKGGVGVTYLGSPKVIANSGFITGTPLPASARPTDLRSVAGACSTTDSDVLSVKIDVNPDGRIQIVGTTTPAANPKIQPPWVSFNNILVAL
jgi:hypothetical protein